VDIDCGWGKPKVCAAVRMEMTNGVERNDIPLITLSVAVVVPVFLEGDGVV
jgi:hypothetical protein